MNNVWVEPLKLYEPMVWFNLVSFPSLLPFFLVLISQRLGWFPMWKASDTVTPFLRHQWMDITDVHVCEGSSQLVWHRSPPAWHLLPGTPQNQGKVPMLDRLYQIHQAGYIKHDKNISSLAQCSCSGIFCNILSPFWLDTEYITSINY